MKQRFHHRCVALVTAGLWIGLSAGCVTSGPPIAGSFQSAPTSPAADTYDSPVQATVAAEAPTSRPADRAAAMPGSLQSKLAGQFRRLGIGWRAGDRPSQAPTDQASTTPVSPQPTSATHPATHQPSDRNATSAATLNVDNREARIANAGSAAAPDGQFGPATAEPKVDDHIRPVAYEQVPGEKHYANPTPLSRDAAGLMPGDPYAPGPIVPVPVPYGPVAPGPYGPGPYGPPALPYPGYDGFAPPMDQAPPIDANTPHLHDPSDSGMFDPTDLNDARSRETFDPDSRQPGREFQQAPNPNDREPRSTEELPLPTPIDNSSGASLPQRTYRAATPQRRAPEHVQPGQTSYTFGDQQPATSASGYAAYPTDSWDAATMTGRGYLAAGSAMHGSQLRSTPLTATEIALQLKQENETLRERMRFAEAAQNRAESRLSAVEAELAKLQSELAEAKQSMARLSLANRKLDQQLAAERAEKERLRQHSDAALRNIEETLDTVLLNTISPRK